MTTTTTSQVVSTCGTIYGCEAEDSATTTTDATTETETPTLTLRSLAFETWGSFDMTDEEKDETADYAQSLLDEEFGSEEPTTTEEAPTSEVATTTEEPTIPEEPTTTEEPPTSEEITTTEEPTITEEPTTTEEPPTSEVATSTEELPTSEEATTTEEPVSTTEEPSVTTTEEPSTPTTPLEKQEIKCHDVNDFPGHADVSSKAQEDLAATFGTLKPNGSDDISADSEPFEWYKEDTSGISYTFSVYWVSGCVTETETQSFRYPLGAGSDVSAYSLVREDYTQCKFPHTIM